MAAAGAAGGVVDHLESSMQYQCGNIIILNSVFQLVFWRAFGTCACFSLSVFLAVFGRFSAILHRVQLRQESQKLSGYDEEGVDLTPIYTIEEEEEEGGTEAAVGVVHGEGDRDGVDSEIEKEKVQEVPLKSPASPATAPAQPNHCFGVKTLILSQGLLYLYYTIYMDDTLRNIELCACLWCVAMEVNPTPVCVCCSSLRSIESIS